MASGGESASLFRCKNKRIGHGARQIWTEARFAAKSFKSALSEMQP
jgi:hypothetical protein